MARIASSAVPSSTAATPTTSSPAQKISVPGFWMILHGFDARHLLGGAGVDAGDARVRVRTAQDFAGQQSVGIVVDRCISHDRKLSLGRRRGRSACRAADGLRDRARIFAHDFTLAGLRSFRQCDGANSVVGSAAAEVAAQAAANVFRCRFWSAAEESGGSDDEARRAETALLRVVSDECLHYRSEIVAFRQPFDRRDLLALALRWPAPSTHTPACRPSVPCRPRKCRGRRRSSRRSGRSCRAAHRASVTRGSS